MRRIALIAAAVAVFLLASAVVARVLGAANSERDAAVEAVKARAGSGDFRVLRVDSGSRVALGSRTVTARVVWRAGDRLPVVQCVRVRRSGDLVSGYDVRALSVSRPIPREGGC